MITYAPYVLAVAGCTLLLQVALATTRSPFAFMLHRFIPAAIGAAAIWMSALMFVGGA